MAWGRKKSGGRKEPQFGLAASLSELRLGPQDRVAGGDDEPKKKPSAKRKAGDSGDDAPRERKPRAKAASSKRKSRARARSGLGRLVYWGAVLGLWAVIAAVGVVIWVGAHLPAIQSLEIPKRPPTIQIVGFDGSVLATRGEMAGANVSLKDLPPHLPKAFIAIEDRRFYSHYGIDPIGIARAAVANVLHRGVSQGGSTLTQQLAKNLFLTQERTFMRKLQEVELALWLERKHSKTEILELYLNRVYFGSGAYGVEAAAQRYFGKPAKNVTIAEAAMLAGLVKSPSRLAPNRNPEGAEKRAQTVLAAMADAKFITEAQAKASIGQPSTNVKAAGAGTINYVADWIGEVLDDLIGQIDQNIVVETSIDPKLQSVAEAAIIDELAAKSVKFNVTQGALVAMTPDGAVRAMVGGRNYAESQYQPRGHREAPAGLGVQAVRLSHRDRSRIDAGDDPAGCAARRQGLEARELHPRIFRRGDADAGAGDVAQHGGGAARPRSRGQERGAHRAPARHFLETRGQCLDRARHLGSLAQRTGRRLCAVRQWRPGVDAACRDQDPHRRRQGAVCPARRPARPGDRSAPCRDDEHA